MRRRVQCVPAYAQGPLNACESSQEAYDCGSVQFASICPPSSRGGTAVDARDGLAGKVQYNSSRKDFFFFFPRGDVIGA
ncbi:hypothetical protein M434DRAFT_394761 [Hypoxylon sp. CO27-5]|nr:hypothetical protein M434DRAFT_394761 [Hypoxylon sp. CO27-5]